MLYEIRPIYNSFLYLNIDNFILYKSLIESVKSVEFIK